MKHITEIIAVGIALVAAGCSTPDGLPPGARVVGGGPKISWSSQKSGTAILVEKTTHKTILTESINGNNLEFDASNGSDQQILKAALGTTPTNAQFVLYFVPDRR